LLGDFFVFILLWRHFGDKVISVQQLHITNSTMNFSHIQEYGTNC
jgi:hypothetical protein